ncbi:MAG: hypothetical protein BGN91_09215 [Nitrobacter sp. 62-13]|jgi:hypothetical protein|uniref:hypothetical protein n=1 Tax=Nitrobacter sp. 62-13 TaxID=1895797 RepID=UPI000964CA5D|nr:hypothetical protein [Nitrobacter sp. 62-13]OJU27110.1 MAG: hypothetical protein BGN91_09215 [Nitrobacter sp. 62-13]
MHALLRIVGVITLVAGLGFMGQGFRFYNLPADSILVRHTEWVYYGAGMAVIGFLLIIFSRPSEEP